MIELTDFEKEVIRTFRRASKLERDFLERPAFRDEFLKYDTSIMTPREFWEGPGSQLNLEDLADRKKPLPADIEMEPLLTYSTILFHELYDFKYRMEEPDLSIPDDRMSMMETINPGITEWYRNRVAGATVLDLHREDK